MLSHEIGTACCQHAPHDLDALLEASHPLIGDHTYLVVVETVAYTDSEGVSTTSHVGDCRCEVCQHRGCPIRRVDHRVPDVDRRRGCRQGCGNHETLASPNRLLRERVVALSSGAVREMIRYDDDVEANSLGLQSLFPKVLPGDFAGLSRWRVQIDCHSKPHGGILGQRCSQGGETGS